MLSAAPRLERAPDTDALAALRLIRSRRVGPATFHRLLTEHGSAAAALEALPAIAEAAGMRDYAPCPEAAARAELRAGSRAGAQLITVFDPDYPAALRDIHDAPPVLWIAGNTDCLTRPLVAVVGARNASSLGLRMAHGLSAGLAAAGVTVVAGLARGVDTAAHQATVTHGTVAVMAGGIDVIYPSENAALAQRIRETGCLLSEQPPGFAPVARHFPARNRIVSGLCRAVVVIEAAHRSGSLITARLALDQGREVMAVPGHPIDPRASGGNSLIRDGATLVRNAGDVLEALGLGIEAGAGISPAKQGIKVEERAEDASPAKQKASMNEAAALTRNAAMPGTSLTQRILNLLGPSPTDENVLAADLGIPPHLLAQAVLALELDGVVERLPGGRLARVA